MDIQLLLTLRSTLLSGSSFLVAWTDPSVQQIAAAHTGRIAIQIFRGIFMDLESQNPLLNHATTQFQMKVLAVLHSIGVFKNFSIRVFLKK